MMSHGCEGEGVCGGGIRTAEQNDTISVLTTQTMFVSHPHPAVLITSGEVGDDVFTRVNSRWPPQLNTSL